MKIRDLASAIESFAPLSLQESYDNSGLIVGRMDDDVTRALLAVDVTEEVLDEAERGLRHYHYAPPDNLPSVEAL